MGVIDLLRTLFPHSENPGKALADLDAQLADLRGRLVEAGHELEARETAAKAATLEVLRAGGRASVSEEVKETRDHIAGLKEAIANIEVRRAEVAIEAAAARKVEAAEAVVRAVKDAGAVYAAAWAVVAVGAAALRRIGAVGPSIGGAPQSVQQFVNDGHMYQTAGASALALLEAAGGSTADLPAEVWASFPFGSEPLPIAQVERALGKVLPSLSGLGSAARESQLAARKAEAEAVALLAKQREEFRRTILDGARRMAALKDEEFVASDDRWLDLAATYAAATNFGESMLSPLFSRVTMARQNQNGAHATVWSADLHRAARVCGWTGPLP